MSDVTATRPSGMADGLAELHSPHGPWWQPKRSMHAQRRRLAYVLMLPLILFVGVMTLYPTVLTTVEAFFREYELSPGHPFVGFGNFKLAFDDPAVRESFINTGIYVVIGTAISTLLGIWIALLLRRPFRFRAVLLALVLLPWGLPPVVEALFWSRIYDPTSGALNGLLTGFHLLNHNIVWLGTNRWTGLLLTEIVQVWQMTPLTVLLVLASLQLIPDELYEASQVDGASQLQVLRRITLPLIRPGITIAMVAAITSSLNIFDQPYILSGDASASASVGLQTYLVSFQNLNFGEGYALSLIMTIATAAVSLVIMKLVYRRVQF